MRRRLGFASFPFLRLDPESLNWLQVTTPCSRVHVDCAPLVLAPVVSPAQLNGKQEGDALTSMVGTGQAQPALPPQR